MGAPIELLDDGMVHGRGGLGIEASFVNAEPMTKSEGTWFTCCIFYALSFEPDFLAPLKLSTKVI